MELRSFQTSVEKYLIFSLDEYRYILSINSVVRVLRAVEVLPLPKAPEIILGIINMHGQVIPVVNVRKRFRLPERQIEPSSHFIVAHTTKRVVALVADRADDVIEHTEQQLISPKEILPEMEYVDGVIKLEDGLAIIHNLDNFLSLKEEQILDHAMRDI